MIPSPPNLAPMPALLLTRVYLNWVDRQAFLINHSISFAPFVDFSADLTLEQVTLSVCRVTTVVSVCLEPVLLLTALCSSHLTLFPTSL